MTYPEMMWHDFQAQLARYVSLRSEYETLRGRVEFHRKMLNVLAPSVGAPHIKLQSRRDARAALAGRGAAPLADIATRPGGREVAP